MRTKTGEDERVLRTLGAGWDIDGDGYRYSPSEDCALRVVRQAGGREWILIRYYDWKDGRGLNATNAMAFPSLRQLVRQLEG